LLRNADVAAVEVDDPLGLDPGDKIVTLRSLRNDPLARLHSPVRSTKRNSRAAGRFQNDWEKAERGPQAVDPSREYVDGGQFREPITEGQRKAVLRLNRIERELGADGSSLVHEVLVLEMTMGRLAGCAGCAVSAGLIILRSDFANAWTGWRWPMDLRRRSGQSKRSQSSPSSPRGRTTARGSGRRV
jgi:hypothetical protein